jgi:hypothetical protein
MIKTLAKTLAMVAAAGLIYIAAPAAPASAQGVTVHVGGGHGGGYHRDRGYRHSRAYMGRDRGFHRHHGWDRGHRSKTVIIRR